MSLDLKTHTSTTISVIQPENSKLGMSNQMHTLSLSFKVQRNKIGVWTLKKQNKNTCTIFLATRCLIGMGLGVGEGCMLFMLTFCLC